MKLKITKEQVKELYNSINKTGSLELLKEMFPEAFIEEIKIGTWIKCVSKGNLLFFKSTEPNSNYGFSFVTKQWSEKLSVRVMDYEFITATDDEVEAALIAEAEKRGFKPGVYFKSMSSGGLVFNTEVVNWKLWGKNGLAMHGCNSVVMRGGIWATIIPTMTKAEAEDKLNCKII